ncbi:Small protein A precursor [Providencia rustigianii]|nr:Small protein A precursor [Providencia rustigianii]
MRYKLLTAAALSFALMSTGCSMMERLVYHPDINQGNYLTAKDVAKIKKRNDTATGRLYFGHPNDD